MYLNLKKTFVFLTVFFLSSINYLLADTNDIKEILNIIQKDLRTLERAVYSDSFSNSKNSSTNQDSSNKEIVID